MRFARALALPCLLLLVSGGLAHAATFQQLSDTQSKIAENHAQEGVLSTSISKLNGQVSSLTQQVATLRNREAAVQADLDRQEARLKVADAQLKAEKKHLKILQARLKRAIRVLEQRLVSIYKSGNPDVLTVILQADGFQDLLTRTEYLDRIEEGDSALVGRVHDLRDETKRAVDHLREVEQTIKKARDEIAAQRAQLARTRSSLESQESALAAARGEKQGALSSLQKETGQLETIEAGLESKIQAQLGSGSMLPVGPVRGGRNGFIWPVNGPVTSGFGYRWGRLHVGIDIAVPEGTPIRATKSGTVALASSYGGYGNYTCINHGGGLSSCYGHQSRFATSAGSSVRQGQVIGYSGNTGNSTGPHLHFEIRVNGVPQDPMGYL